MFKKVISRIFLAVLGFVALLLAVGIFLPSNYGLERSVIIKAPNEKVFSKVNDLKNWEQWSPFYLNDPSMQVMYSAKSEGTDAFYTWTSQNSGDGQLTILASVPNSKIHTLLDFKEQGKGKGVWKFENTEEGIKVTWGFSANAESYFEKYIGVLIDPMLGGVFEEGLSKLKEVSENDSIVLSE